MADVMEHVINILVSGLLQGSVYALMALGLAVIFGVMNISNFAHGEMYMVGAYAAFFAFSTLGLPPPAALAVSLVIGIALGVILQLGTFYPLRLRTKENWVMNAFLMTVGISFVLQNGAQAIWGAKYMGITAYWEGSTKILGLGVSYDRLASAAVAILCIGAFWLFLGRTKAGRAIRAVSQDETGAKLMGINLTRIQTLAFSLSSAMVTLAGASLLSVTPAYPTMGGTPLNKSWFVVMLVGMGKIGPAILGGFLVGLLESVTFAVFGAGWQNVVTLVILVLVLVWKPSGLFGAEVKGIWER